MKELILPGRRKHPHDSVKTFYIHAKIFRRFSDVFRNYCVTCGLQTFMA